MHDERVAGHTTAMAPQPGRWAVLATAEQIARLRSEVTDYAQQVGVPDGRLGDVRLAVSEAATNAVLHAYRDRPPGEIRVDARVTDDGCLRIVVEDDGFGPLPRPDSPGLGLGLPTIASVADAVELSAGSAAGARLSMMFLTGGG
ncbi:MAG TPA: ATP-binding protein [Baekduia sp.]|uniref:ATP-binding protein n=1 Tax=Baekduia sp. TaxID=2600305 RepID=UPI002D76D96A|nr:ATP-binding protein [Baekduia sp.]HET6507139.1 ATP-binding protein [Baekduia sp.]